MSDALIRYLQDHLAGASHATELLQAMRDHHAEDPLGQFAAQLLREIEADRDVGALTEKASRLKLKHGEGSGLGTFEALAFLVIGIHGKWALWRALSVAGSDSVCRELILIISPDVHGAA
jgi:hypothetical protein